MSNRNDFVIQNGVLKEYSGQYGDIVIPDEVVKIERCAFASNGWIRDVTFPSHQVEMDYGAFYGCSNLKHMTIPVCSLAGTIFGEAGKTMLMTLIQENGEPMKVVASFRKAYWAQTWAYKEDYLVPLTSEDLPNYDRLVAAGDFEGFKMNEQGRLQAMLLRLQEANRPVTEEYRDMFVNFLTEKITKVIKMAKDDGNTSYLDLMKTAKRFMI